MDGLTSGINLSSAGTGEQAFDFSPKTETKPKKKRSSSTSIDLNETSEMILACQQ
mgnify:CR=1 FL=1